MMEFYKKYVNKPIINQNNENGVVLSFDRDRIVIQYASTEKAYSPKVAFNTGFLKFVDIGLQQKVIQSLIDQDMSAKKEKEKIAEDKRKYLAKKKEVRKEYVRMYIKYRSLLRLFGTDFTYPPFVEMEKKYEKYGGKKTDNPQVHKTFNR